MRVNVDGSALTDARIKRLAIRLGWSHFEALGRLVHVWAYLYDREGAPLHAEEVDAAAEREGFAAALIHVGLAKDTPDGVVVAGRERASWVADRRAAASNAGRARAAAAPRSDGRFGKGSTQNQRHAGEATSVAPASHQPNTSPLTPALSPALALVLPSGERAALELTPSEPKPAKRGSKAASAHLTLAAELWAEQDRLRQEAIPGVRSLAPTASAIALVAARLDEGHSPEDCRHVLQVYAADAKADPGKQAQWFNGETNWRPENFRRALGRTLARASPDPRRGSVKPLAAHEYPVDKVEF